MQTNIYISNLFDLRHTAADDYLTRFLYPWEAIAGLARFLEEYASTLGDDYEKHEGNVRIARSAKVSPTAFIGPNTVIGPDAEIRHGAYLRGNALVGRGCVIGNASEVKNSILLDGAQLPHYNYVGDSLIGARAHLGAGAIVSNLKLNGTPVTVTAEGERIPTGLRKFGAAVGDGAEIGANAVLCPGSIVGREAIVYPLVCVRGAVAAGGILKSAGARREAVR